MLVMHRGGHQLLESRTHGLGPQEPRLVRPSGMQETLGEGVASLRVRGQLDLIHADEIHLQIERHRLDRADPVARMTGYPLFLARHQRNVALANFCRDTVVDLACQQSQRQSNNASAMHKHTLDRAMRLACVGRAQERSHARDWPLPHSLADGQRRALYANRTHEAVHKATHKHISIGHWIRWMRLTDTPVDQQRRESMNGSPEQQ